MIFLLQTYMSFYGLVEFLLFKNDSIVNIYTFFM